MDGAESLPRSFSAEVFPGRPTKLRFLRSVSSHPGRGPPLRRGRPVQSPRLGPVAAGQRGCPIRRAGTRIRWYRGSRVRYGPAGVVRPGHTGVHHPGRPNEAPPASRIATGNPVGGPGQAGQDTFSSRVRPAVPSESSNSCRCPWSRRDSRNSARGCSPRADALCAAALRLRRDGRASRGASLRAPREPCPSPPLGGLGRPARRGGIRRAGGFAAAGLAIIAGGARAESSSPTARFSSRQSSPLPRARLIAPATRRDENPGSDDFLYYNYLQSLYMRRARGPLGRRAGFAAETGVRHVLERVDWCNRTCAALDVLAVLPWRRGVASTGGAWDLARRCPILSMPLFRCRGTAGRPPTRSRASSG